MIRIVSASRATQLTKQISFNQSARQLSILNAIFTKFFKMIPHKGPANITYLPEKKLAELCDRNFERQLKELAEKAKETATQDASNLPK